MNVFDIEYGGGKSVTVFANNFDQGDQIFCDWHLSVYGCMPEEFIIGRRRRGRAKQQRQEIDAALSLGIAGVGTWEQGTGWTIVLPPVSDG